MATSTREEGAGIVEGTSPVMDGNQRPKRADFHVGPGVCELLERMCSDGRAPEPERVLFDGPATIVFWDDGSKTVAKCAAGDAYSEHAGFMAAFCKRFITGSRMGRLVSGAERRNVPVPGRAVGTADWEAARLAEISSTLRRLNELAETAGGDQRIATALRYASYAVDYMLGKVFVNESDPEGLSAYWIGAARGVMEEIEADGR